MKKLKPCPFCGGKANVMHMGYPHWVYCEDCGAKVHGRVIWEKEGVSASIEAWNKRAESGRVAYTPLEVETALILYGQTDKRFAYGEVIKYSPSDVRKILLRDET